MLRDGKIVAAAPHAQLLVTCPEYREMYDAQAEWYEDAGE
jgi:ABC-type multidrug transport system fused ATPase/permease subunit